MDSLIELQEYGRDLYNLVTLFYEKLMLRSTNLR